MCVVRDTPPGAAVIYQPTSDEDITRTHIMHRTCLDGVLMGYAQQRGGGLMGGCG